MKALAAILLAIALLPNCRAQEDLSLYAPLNATDSAGQKQGIWVEHYESGAVKSVCQYKAGVLNGTYVSFTERGELQSSAAFNQGKLNGITRDMVPSDGTVRVALYQHGIVQSVKVFDRKGTLELEEYYKDGQILKSVHHTPTGIIEGHPVKTP